MSLLLTSFAASLLALFGVRIATRRDPAGASLLSLVSVHLLLVLPLLTVLPKVHLAVPATAGPLSSAAPVLPSLAWIWLLGLALFGLRLAADHVALVRWRSQAVACGDPRLRDALAACRRQLGLRREVPLCIHPAISSPLIAGLRRPAVFLPRHATAWSDDTLHMVLLHELGHLARRDLWTGFTARLACLVHWFNPFAWMLRRHLMTQCEFACDTFVIAAGANPATYATALCDVAEDASPPPAAALAMAGHAPLRQRVERLVRGPRRVAPLLVIGALLFTVTASVALSVVRFRSELPGSAYTPEEVEMRLTADPFPGD